MYTLLLQVFLKEYAITPPFLPPIYFTVQVTNFIRIHTTAIANTDLSIFWPQLQLYQHEVLPN